MFLRPTGQPAEAEGIAETLNVGGQTERVGRMNSIRNRAAEVVNNELILI